MNTKIRTAIVTFIAAGSFAIAAVAPPVSGAFINDNVKSQPTPPPPPVVVIGTIWPMW